MNYNFEYVGTFPLRYIKPYQRKKHRPVKMIGFKHIELTKEERREKYLMERTKKLQDNK